MAAQKTPCTITRRDFRADAPNTITVVINGENHTAEKKEFSTGSFGYYLGGKATVTIAGKPHKLQIGLNLTIVNSKDAKEE